MRTLLTISVDFNPDPRSQIRKQLSYIAVYSSRYINTHAHTYIHSHMRMRTSTWRNNANKSINVYFPTHRQIDKHPPPILVYLKFRLIFLTYFSTRLKANKNSGDFSSPPPSPPKNILLEVNIFSADGVKNKKNGVRGGGSHLSVLIFLEFSSSFRI